MTEQEFDAWAYSRVRVFFEETVPSVVERPGFERAKVFLTGLERERAWMAPKVDDPN